MPNITWSTKFIDRTGQRFNRLVVLEKISNNKYGQIMWRCRCDCGNELDVRATNLNTGNTKSCRCLMRDRIKETWRINHTGERFGRLTVVRYLYTDKHKKTIWECRCDCGNVARIHGASLREGITTSCGCVHKEMVSKMFTTHGLSKTKQYKRMIDIKRRALKKSTDDGTVTLRYIEELLTQPCSYCWSTDDIQIDHVEPISRGASTVLTILCRHVENVTLVKGYTVDNLASESTRQISSITNHNSKQL